MQVEKGHLIRKLDALQFSQTEQCTIAYDNQS